MHIQEWLRSLRPGSGPKGSDLEDLWNLLPSLPLSSSSLSSLSLSPSSLLGLGALASLTVYWLVTRPRPMRPPCDLQAQSVAVDVSSVCVCVRVYVRVCVFNTLNAPLTAGRPQLQALGSACRRLAAGVLLRWHQDFLRHVPEGPEDRRWRTETPSFSFPFFFQILRDVRPNYGTVSPDGNKDTQQKLKIPSPKYQMH